MSRPQYTDPYSAETSRYYYQNDSVDFSDPTRGTYPHQTYDNTGSNFDPYSSSSLNQAQDPTDDLARDGHQRNLSRSETKKVSYAQDGMDYDLGRNASVMQRTGASTRKPTPSTLSLEPVRKQWNGFDHGEFTPTVTRRPGKKGLKSYRREAGGNLWTKGGGLRACGRFFCCTFLVAILVIVGTVLSLALWARPPSIDIGDVITRNTTGSLSSPEGLEINLSVDIAVNNPNYFTVEFTKVKVEINYPNERKTPVGGGEVKDIVFKSGEETEFTFPFKLSYRSADDPGNEVFLDLGRKCGIENGRKENIVVDYKLSLGIKLLSLVTITPVVSNRFSFACPDALVAGANSVITGTTTPN